ncbi:MAG: alkane 1-monooxygenase [Saprospiraceae bacterium]|nr:alkane 1-monooxygenase [Saprospiraceae bacterium]
MSNLKYLLAYIAPLSAFAGIYLGGFWSFGAIYVGFVFIPALELILPHSTKNFTPKLEEKKSQNQYFDWLLYLNIPILLLLLWYYFETVSIGGLSLLEIVGMSFNVGMIVGTIGINVAHELGHRQNILEQRMAQLLLCTALYMHFFVEHNRGHHKNVSTDLDPASAKRGEMIYLFWIKSLFGGYKNAWKLENERLSRAGKSSWSFSNQMIRFTMAEIMYLSFLISIWSWAILPYAFAVALIGILLLESVNYIEHYGLRRNRLASGRFEPVSPSHSWNSDHELGRIFLYELTRHSDHHFKATRKYQVLRHFQESPQLPVGYPGSILLALVPPVWFRLMNPQVDQIEKDRRA